MSISLHSILPDNDRARWWFAVVTTVLIAGLLTLLGIYGINHYGIALFVLTPVFIGTAPVVLFGLKKKLSLSEARGLAFTALAIFIVGLLAFAIEGVVCIVMAAPIIIPLVWLGSITGHTIVNFSEITATTIIVALMCLIPTMAFVESDTAPQLTPVVTSVEIHADPETVWQNVVTFPQIDEPTELLFKTGIAYPINAKIEGSGLGAIRRCNFTTGSFVEPITVWNEPHLLAFDVAEQPKPMKELSFWDIDAPHLHDYFVSKRGQFKLTALANGNTLLEGTTWYYDNIHPAFYWQLWSDYIVHAIHNRVLMHIKGNAERQ